MYEGICMKKILVLLALLMTASASAKVIATVDGYPIHEKEANAFLKVATKGKVTYKRLKKKDKRDLVERLAVDKLVLKTALREISKNERNQIIAGYWLRQKSAKMKVTDKEVKDAYKENKKFFKDKKNKTIPFEKVKQMIRTSILQKKAVAKMMKKATIKMGSKGIISDKKRKEMNAKKYTTYTVKSGNTLSGIAQKYNTTVKALRNSNNMSEKDNIKIGQKLKVPN